MYLPNVTFVSGVTFFPSGESNTDMNLTVTMQIFGETWSFVLTVPYAHWSYALQAAGCGAPGDAAEAYTWFPNFQVFWNMLATGFAYYASQFAVQGAGSTLMEGWTPSAAWVSQYARWFYNIQRLSHPAELKTLNTYGAPLNACANGQGGGFQMAA